MTKIFKTTIRLSVVASAFIFVGCTVEPKIITPAEIKQDVQQNLEEIQTIVVPVTKAITLDEAIDRAIKHNLEQKMNILNAVLAEQKIDAATYEALPELAAKAGYSQRDNYAASQSTTFENGEPGDLTNAYSISQDKTTNTAGTSFSWNVLDFGLSYVRAKQQSDKYLIAKENERKAKYNLAQNVRQAYYKAVSADELLMKLQPIMVKTKEALKNASDIHKYKLDTPMKALTYQRELLEIVRVLNSLEESLSQSKIELAKLMGLKPGSQFELAEKIQTKYTLPKISISVNELEQIALENRPELQESRYQIRISQEELTALKLKLLPGINVNAGYNYDDNKYLLNNDWMSYGANVSWNLFSVFSHNQNSKIAQTSLELAKLQKTALSVAIISQVHLAMIDYAQAKKEYEVSEQYAEVAKDIFGIIQSETNLNVNNRLSLIKEELNHLVSNLKLASSYAKVQNAYGRLMVSVGKPEMFEEVKQDIQVPKKSEAKPSEQAVTNEKIATRQTNTEDSVSLEQKQIQPQIQQAIVVKEEIPISKEVQQLGSDEIYAMTTGQIYVRAQPNKNATRLGSIKNHTPIKVRVHNEDWYAYENGYVRSTWLKKIEEHEYADFFDKQEKILKSEKEYAQVIADIYLRESPKNDSKIVKTVYRNEYIEIIGSKNGWKQTPDGFIHRKYLKISGQ